jgi:hypothetical protein
MNLLLRHFMAFGMIADSLLRLCDWLWLANPSQSCREDDFLSKAEQVSLLKYSNSGFIHYLYFG